MESTGNLPIVVIRVSCVQKVRAWFPAPRTLSRARGDSMQSSVAKTSCKGNGRVEEEVAVGQRTEEGRERSWETLADEDGSHDDATPGTRNGLAILDSIPARHILTSNLTTTSSLFEPS